MDLLLTEHLILISNTIFFSSLSSFSLPSFCPLVLFFCFILPSICYCFLSISISLPKIRLGLNEPKQLNLLISILLDLTELTNNTTKNSKYQLNTKQIKPKTFYNNCTNSTPHISQNEQLTESTLAQMRHQVMQQRVKVEEER